MHVSAVQAHPSTWIIPLHGVPGGLVGYPRASLKSILWVQFSPIAHSRRDFLHKKSDQRTAREREFATFGENRRAVRMLTPMSDKNEGTYRGGEGTTPVTTAFVQKIAEGTSKTSYELS